MTIMDNIVDSKDEDMDVRNGGREALRGRSLRNPTLYNDPPGGLVPVQLKPCQILTGSFLLTLPYVSKAGDRLT